MAALLNNELNCPTCGNEMTFIAEDLDQATLVCKECIVFQDL